MYFSRTTVKTLPLVVILLIIISYNTLSSDGLCIFNYIFILCYPSLPLGWPCYWIHPLPWIQPLPYQCQAADVGSTCSSAAQLHRKAECDWGVYCIHMLTGCDGMRLYHSIYIYTWDCALCDWGKSIKHISVVLRVHVCVCARVLVMLFTGAKVDASTQNCSWCIQ